MVHCQTWAVQQKTGCRVSMSDLYFQLHIDYSTREIAISGEFDVATAQCLATAVAGVQRAAAGDISIGLDDVTFIDAAGLGAVVSAQSAQVERGSRLTVTGANTTVRRAFTLGRLANLLSGGACAVS
jgi:anti-sigma B factor antagonist